MRALAIICIFILPAGVLAETPLATLEQRCDACHGDSGDAAIPGWPPITSYSADELSGKLKGYRERYNSESVMTDVAHDLTDEEIAKLAAHYAIPSTR